MTVVTLNLIRHGQTLNNAKGIIQGQSGGELSALGLAQAEQTGKWLASSGRSFRGIVASDLHRCVQTANLVNSQIAVPVRYEERLRERSYGDFEGLPGTVFQEAFKSSQTPWHQFAAPRGESFEAVVERVRPVVAEIVEQVAAPDSAASSNHAAEKILVAHAGIIRALVVALGLVSLDEIRSMIPGNCSVTTIELPLINRSGAQARLLEWNQLSHLESINS